MTNLAEISLCVCVCRLLMPNLCFKWVQDAPREDASNLLWGAEVLGAD